MDPETPETGLDTPSTERILSHPSKLTTKYHSHLTSSTKSSSSISSSTSCSPFLTQISSSSSTESLINPNMVQIFYW